MPLQYRTDTGALIMLDSGALANECCCPAAIPDLTPIMRSLSEALHYIADENSLNQEFGGVQGDAWPTQREAPFLPPPADGENIPSDFYEGDYTADIQNAYDDLQTIIDNYNYVKNFFLKTDPFEGATSLANYTGADDYNPGVINASNFNSIRAAIVALTNDILNVMVQATQTVTCCKTAISTYFFDNAEWLSRQACAIDYIDNILACGETVNVVSVDPIPADCGFEVDGACGGTQALSVEVTDFDLDTCLQVDATLSFVTAVVDADLTNFLSADQAGVYLKPETISAIPFSSLGPVPLPDVYQNWIAPTLGVLYTSPIITGSDTRLAFTFTGPTPACTGGALQVGTGWRILDTVIILTRPQVHVAS